MGGRLKKGELGRKAGGGKGWGGRLREGQVGRKTKRGTGGEED